VALDVQAPNDGPGWDNAPGSVMEARIPRAIRVRKVTRVPSDQQVLPWVHWHPGRPGGGCPARFRMVLMQLVV